MPHLNPKPALEVLLSDDSPAQRAVLPPGFAAAGAGISYPEWDFRIPGYRERGAVVRLQASPLGDPAWVESVLAERYGLLQQVRRRFEGMRPRRIRQNRQADGHDLDISAYVNAFAEQHMGLPLEDRLYQSVRPARRDIAIALLIDISGSTDGWVSGDLRIIDVEKEALLLVYYALIALSDPFCILAFSGESAQNVTLWSVKDLTKAIIISYTAVLPDWNLNVIRARAQLFGIQRACSPLALPCIVYLFYYPMANRTMSIYTKAPMVWKT